MATRKKLGEIVKTTSVNMAAGEHIEGQVYCYCCMATKNMLLMIGQFVLESLRDHVTHSM